MYVSSGILTLNPSKGVAADRRLSSHEALDLLENIISWMWMMLNSLRDKTVINCAINEPPLSKTLVLQNC
jgi:hypothetical protein